MIARRLSPLVAAVLLVAACGDGGTDPVTVQSVSVSPPTGTVGVGESARFSATVLDQNGNVLAGRKVLWSTGDGSVAAVDSTGLATAVAPGSTTVRATVEGKSGSAELSVLNAAPQASIASPAAGSVHPQSSAISFQGSASDLEDGSLSGSALAWTSDQAGALGTGASFERSDLAAGAHTITLTATDSHGGQATVTVQITVNPVPTVTIASPASGSVYTAGETISFAGSATDPDDGAVTGDALAWTSDLDGQLGTGGSVARSDLSAGTHTVTLTATDTQGGQGSASVTVEVNQPPTAGFTTDCTDLSCTFTDASADADGTIAMWSWDFGDGATSAEASPSHTYASGATYTVTLMVTDDDGASDDHSEPVAVTPPCDPSGPDADADGLADCAETNTGVYNSATDTGTDPADPDTDGDFISDGDEVLGSAGGLDLPGLGVNPLRQDILLEYDWFVDVNSCGRHTHEPTADQIAAVEAAFANAPVLNPDGSSGINVIQDYGQGGVFTGGEEVSDADGVIAGGVNGSDFLGYKSANFAGERNGYFHYVLMPHRYNTDSGSSGQAEVYGDDMIVSLQCAVSSTSAVANTIVHELGHNLGLRHGGDEERNWKPSYNSVMSYKYQFSGVDDDCTPPGNGVLDYSRGDRPSLDENDLDEAAGICGSGAGQPWDWNGDGDTADSGLALDINVDNSGTGDGSLSVLHDYDDWGSLYLGGLLSPDGLGVSAPREIVGCMDTPTPLPR